jgi:hypothetical protein
VTHAQWNCHVVVVMNVLQSIEAKLHKETIFKKTKELIKLAKLKDK